LFTFLPIDEIDALVAEHEQNPGLRAAQRRLAAEVTALVHGQAEVDAAVLASSALFGRGDLADLPEPTLAAALREAGAAELSLNDSPTIVDALEAVGLVKSRSEARRAITEGGAYVNNERVDDPDLVLDGGHALHGSWVVLRRGKRAVSGVRLV
jgi:tyrosyl-tRNA synthetase